MSASFHESTTVLSFSSGGAKALAGHSSVFLLKETVGSRRFAINGLKALDRPRNECCSVCVMKFHNFATASVAQSGRSQWPVRRA